MIADLSGDQLSSALNVTRHGLGTGRSEAIAELVNHVRLNRLDGV